MALKMRNRPAADIPCVSMSDVAFLLLIFFLSATQFMKKGMDLDVPSRDTEKQAPEDQKTTTVTIIGQDKVLLNESDLPKENLLPELKKIMDKADKKDPNARAVVVKFANAAAYGLFVEVVDTIKLVEGIPVLELEEEKAGEGGSGAAPAAGGEKAAEGAKAGGEKAGEKPAETPKKASPAGTGTPKPEAIGAKSAGQ